MSDTNAFTVDELAELLMSTGHHHHQAYQESDGADPEWALWYSGFLQAKIWDRFGAIPTRSALVHALVEADRTFAPTDEYPDWPHAYAAQMIERFSS